MADTEKAEIMKNEQVQNDDVIEELMQFFLENKEVSAQLLDLIRAVKDSGAIEDLAAFARSVVPSNSALVREIGSSEEVVGAISKAGNLLPALLFLLNDKMVNDTLQAMLYNSGSLFGAMVSGAKNPEQFSLLKLLALFKDQEFTKGFTALVNMITALGKILARVPEE